MGYNKAHAIGLPKAHAIHTIKRIAKTLLRSG